MVIIRRKGGGEVGEGAGGQMVMTGDWTWVVNTHYNTQLMC